MKKLKQIIVLVVLLVAVDILASFIWFMNVVATEKTEYLEKADIGIVLMGDVDGNFADIGPQTRRRLDHALKLQEQGFFGRFLCVGGYRPVRNFSGAQKMKDYLLRHGIKEDNIFLEPNSYDTKTNLRYTAPILRKHKWYSVILISSPLHVHRIKKMDEFKYLQGRIVQWAPHSYADPKVKTPVFETWQRIHYEWVSYALGLLPYQIYAPIVNFIREQKPGAVLETPQAAVEPASAAPETAVPAILPGKTVPDDQLVRKKLTYEAFDAQTNNTIDRTFVYITEQPNKQKFVQWFLVKKNFPLVEEYVLNNAWETVSWKSSLSNVGTEYAGTKQGNSLVLKGKFKNEEFSKVIELNKDLPFYYNPKLGLKGFVLSSEKKIEFWGFRTDDLTEFKMKAEKKGVYRLTVNGESFDALKIYWAATGLGEKFFNRTYYFRLSDAEFISQDTSDKWKMKLVGMETTLVARDNQRVDHP